jgi:hypothetical protein
VPQSTPVFSKKAGKSRLETARGSVIAHFTIGVVTRYRPRVRGNIPRCWKWPQGRFIGETSCVGDGEFCYDKLWQKNGFGNASGLDGCDV